MASNAGSFGASQPGGPTGELHASSRDVLRAARAISELQSADQEARERRILEMMADHMLMPMTVCDVTITGAKGIRRGFLDPILGPLISDAPDAPSTVAAVLASLDAAAERVSRMQILRERPSIYLSRPSRGDASASPTDVSVSIGLRELPRFKLQTGTDVGNGEGSAYGSLLWRNMFGGAEMLTLNAKAGTRTRSAYSANLSTPILSNPDMSVSLEGLASASDKPWASHEEVAKGGSVRFSWLNRQADKHSVEYTGVWRQVTGLSSHASPTVRQDAGDSVKSAIKHTFRRERRDNPQLPQQGYMVRSVCELAGAGPLAGDVAFSKSELEISGAVPVPLPGVPGRTGISIGAGLRAGMLWPLPLGFDLGGEALPSRLNDRFLLGGPTDVRGFKLGGLGPHDGPDSVGGDVFAAGSVNLLLPLPHRTPESRLRLQIFVNGGRLTALAKKARENESSSQGMTAMAVCDGMLDAVGRLMNGAPSTAAGVGLFYAHPAARFEMNFSLPLVLRRGEVATKGLQVGVGINFL